ncbi:hypothetical protein RM609_25675 [Streptomyces sp. DSM 40473]|uniref:Uncharacterized protein n=2 Tax=Streptomyces hesseae TaxID=3075519 RepID=A0ABU2STW8_9ACTN|nr:hypothetical protein [Streptomyces sp. DSM 40473]MDT0452453.1 hypothetical protein [Streptomyces sp. DSM 40473]
MTVFACAGCDAVLSAPLTEVALPDHAHQKWGNGVMLPVLMESGTYAVDPEPSGPPWRPWHEVGEAEAASRGVFAPVYGLSYAAPGEIVVAPGDTRGTVLIPERCEGYCCGLTGADGPNLACERCGRPVATRIDDCSLWQAVWFTPDAVRRLPVDGPVPWASGWEALARGPQGVPPLSRSGAWSREWEAAVGAALAHVLVASEGAPVVVPDGLVADTFRRALDALLPQGAPVKTLALAGPGLPAPDPAAGILLVPRHPLTGEAWRPPSGTSRTAPLAAGMWTRLAFPGERPWQPAAGGLPDGVLRDDPLPLLPDRFFEPDDRVLLDTLARLPAVRQPWLRAVHDRVNRPYARFIQGV